MIRVVFITAILTHYRLPFHERVRALLSAKGIGYELLYGQPAGSEAAKGDTATLPWATPLRNRHFGPFVWQPAWRHIRGADLVVIGQENKLLLNYVLQLLPRRLRPHIALFGHGRNFQSRAPNGIAEWWKRCWATHCDWWFAYTEETYRHLTAAGFPGKRITVFNNSVDTTALRRFAEAVTPQRLDARRAELGLAGRNVGIYVGGLYPDKRLDFLVRACDRVRETIPDFELLIVGGGPLQRELEALASTRPWMTLTGPRFGADKAELMALGHLFLIPGLVGLAILDAGVAGLPVVTTAFPWHSPEIAYLQDGENGVMTAYEDDETAYADAVTELLLDPVRRNAMAGKSRTHAASYSIEAMAERFADGIETALASS